MFLSSQCGRDDTRIISQVPLTKAGEDGMGGDRGGSVWLGEVHKMLSVIFFVSSFQALQLSVNTGCNIAQWYRVGLFCQKGTERVVENKSKN